ncbi:HIT family protein [Streptomyces uncialis]|uniref:HIT family protein n=1 Tax=Streptomyces uncialis TaxID=1048205 RepID=UPI0037A71D14
MDGGCVFCAIARGEVAASLVFEDAWVIAFMDLQPVTPGHLLVVPRSHAEGLEDLPEDIGVRIWVVAHRLGRALRLSGLRCEGVVNLFLADGEAAFQEVFHVHLHVFPRFS